MRVHERRRIYAFLDGRLSERGYAKLERHLLDCETCRTHLEQARLARGVLAEMGDNSPEVDLESVRRELLRNLDEPVQRHATLLWSWQGLGLGVMAAAAALVLLVAIPRLHSPGGEGQPPRPIENGPVVAQRTAIDASPMSGRITLMGEGALYRRPGMRWHDADLFTLVSSGTEMVTGPRAAASVQLAPMSGVRIEPGSQVTFRDLVHDSVEVDLAKGMVSVHVEQGSGLRDLRVRTDQTLVRLVGTTASIELKGGATVLVIDDGKVRVRALSNSAERMVAGPAVITIDEHGIRETALGQGEDPVARLARVGFNLFERIPYGRQVSFVPASGDGEVSVSIGGQGVGWAPLSMLVPEGVGEATLTFEDGSSIRTSFSLKGGEHTVVSFTPPSIEVAPALLAGKSMKPRLALTEQNVEPQEEPEQVHEGVLDPQLVKLVMKKHKGRLRGCYEKYLDDEPEQVVVKARILFTVGTSGKVVDVTAETSVKDTGICTCLEAAMKTVAFPPPAGGTVQFAYPITFSPQ